MTCDLMFDVIFTAPDGTETVLDAWTCAENMGYSYKEKPVKRNDDSRKHPN